MRRKQFLIFWWCPRTMWIFDATPIVYTHEFMNLIIVYHWVYFYDPITRVGRYCRIFYLFTALLSYVLFFAAKRIFLVSISDSRYNKFCATNLVLDLWGTVQSILVKPTTIFVFFCVIFTRIKNRKYLEKNMSWLEKGL